MRGLTNQNSHCGLNSVVQCLSATNELQELMGHKECSEAVHLDRDHEKPVCATKPKMVTAALRELLGEMARDEKLTPCDPTALYDAMSTYLGIAQEDELKAGSETLTSFDALIDTDSIFKCIVNALADNTDPVASEASRLWSFEKQRIITCLGCDRSLLPTFDKANDIHVYMNEDNPRDLQGYVNQYSESFTVSDYDGCVDCGTATQLRVECFITKLPRVACVILNRVKNVGPTTTDIVKDETLFEFPETLDLSPILVDLSPQPYGRCLYELYGVIAHVGSHDHGHYTAYVKRKEQWYYVNDTQVTSCSWECIRRTYQSSPNGVAYMLMYRKKCNTKNLEVSTQYTLWP